MKIIHTNNDSLFTIKKTSNGIFVKGFGSNDNEMCIPDHEIVMLLNYYHNCKEGLESQDYINDKPYTLKDIR